MMKEFESLFSDIPITKILNYFNYRLINQSSKFNTYSKDSSTHIFYLFNDIESDSLQVFSSSSYRKITKPELFCSINSAVNFNAMLESVTQISTFTAIDSNTNLTTSIRVTTLVNLLASLLELDGEVLPITKTPQFKTKIFLNPDGFFKTPLFHYHLEQSSSNRIVNYVHWNESETNYFNNNSYCLNASYYLPENKYLFVTCSPQTWTSFPLLNYSPDYFQVLCHPSASHRFCNLIYNIFIKYNFSKCYLHLNENKEQNIFFSKMLSFFLNQSNSNFHFVIEYCCEHFTINISYQQTRELNIELAKLFSNVSYQVQQKYIGEEQASLELGEVITQLISLESDKLTVGDKVTVIESFAANPKIAILFFNTFLAQMKIGDKIEVLHI